MKTNPSSTLKKYVQTQIRTWTVLGAGISLFFGFFGLIYFGIASSRNHVQTISSSAAKAFRPILLSTNKIREVELQIRDAFHLDADETILVRDPKFRIFYENGNNAKIDKEKPACPEVLKTCWNFRKNQISHLVPIYFDSETKELYGYLEANLKPNYNLPLLFSLFLLICVGFFVQTIGLSMRLVHLTSAIGERLSGWANHIKSHPKEAIEHESVPFNELLPMQEAIYGLRSEIESLEKNAKKSAQLTMIRGIAHDILSPVSQLKKLIFTATHQVESQQFIDDEITNAIHRSLERVTNIARQVKSLQSAPSANPMGSSSFDILPELEQLCQEIQNEDEFKGLKLNIEVLSKNQNGMEVAASRNDCQRIFSNLIRNAAQASPAGGKISVDLSSSDGRPMITVSDEGIGIPDEIKDKIFEADFTTKPGYGTGLGLPVVKHLCENNGAIVQFSTEPGKGSKFNIIFRTLEGAVL